VENYAWSASMNPVKASFEKLQPGFVQSSRGGLWLLLIVLGTWITAAAITGLNFPLLPDERNFHLPTVQLFASLSNLPEALRRLQVANGPLPYIIYALVGRVTGGSLAAMRAVSCLAGAGAALIFYQIARQIDPRPRDRALLPALLLFFYPYFFAYSFTLLVHSLTLFFGLAGVQQFLAFLKNRRPVSILCASLLLALAVLSRQTYLVLGLSIGVWTLAGLMRPRAVDQNLAARPVGSLPALLPALISLAAFGVLAIVWGGWVPPAFQSAHHPQLRVESFSLAAISTAVFLFPVIPLAFRHRKTALVGLAAAVVIGLLQFAAGSSVLLLLNSRGILPLTLTLLAAQLPAAAVLLEWALLWAGCSVLLYVFTQPSVSHRLLLVFFALSSLAAAVFTSYLYELYLVQAMPWLILLGAASIEGKRLRFAWVLVYLLAAAAYFILKIHLQVG
jgi:4-amino-4-deoxy-L-arabinose transferase-like glycosyltransferase